MATKTKMRTATASEPVATEEGLGSGAQVSRRVAEESCLGSTPSCRTICRSCRLRLWEEFQAATRARWQRHAHGHGHRPGGRLAGRLGLAVDVDVGVGGRGG